AAVSACESADRAIEMTVAGLATAGARAPSTGTCTAVTGTPGTPNPTESGVTWAAGTSEALRARPATTTRPPATRRIFIYGKNASRRPVTRPRASARGPPPGRGADRLGFAHQSAEALLQVLLGPVQVDGPADAENAVREDAWVIRIPIRGADAIPGRRTEVVGHQPGY